MPRVIGVDIPDNKRLVIALTYVFGIGPHFAKEIIEKLSFDPNMRAKNLSEDDVAQINKLLETDYTVEGRFASENTGGHQNDWWRLALIEVFVIVLAFR